jgi:hypothetical protein
MTHGLCTSVINILIFVNDTLHFHYRAAKEQKKAVKAAKKVQAPPKASSCVIWHSLYSLLQFGVQLKLKVYTVNCSIKVFLKQKIVGYCEVEEIH